ncbi:tRNA (adenosine(37)-N6)-threonylcarbamoyltransferase complex transferase subunit TsaD [Blastopirellula sp. JC732]|uniref:tRNA N6-adenosine threonylcarbamoyltransferase n=1 Tax=Blastopirellula sediminis TaxID=2894196 RepID=A0A9X1MKJ1_9BACT|nr:tRNA (adenosine(37)-N6)-threonylcarbamoyltransferase complex transferase subunit TsaD [Blastopirellula sediminis]MCC9609602.1 tRNA (adenosine(37)-N6)-threonylcarbamoyltransferase complex transferase subunit TsaD [Blastopirellula sediminis]MCC9627622.1 tRNA (adenosine(37)-N6)-threonylcarbamoyltransferase complex transferase subunit TsaD [Blastopirellula sediminis]
MNLLTIESTCDETAAAIINENLEPLASVVASQEKLHERFNGVVPEIAARAHLERIMPVIDETLAKANLTLADIDAIAVAHTPGLAGSLLVGVSVAKTLAWSLGVPLVGVNHLHGHIYACRLAAGRDIFPCVGLIVSGGHSSLYDCLGPSEFVPLGGTIDDAAGEAFDKVASMLGLPYPGGPSISRCAADGDPHAIPFPRPFLQDHSRLDFSFSGLKTAVRYEIAGPGRPDFSAVEISDQRRADIAASFEQAVVDCLVGKSELALKKSGRGRLCVGGGVAANRKLRTALEEMADRNQIELIIAPFSLCTDNAVMGAIAWERIKAGSYDDLALDAAPGLIRENV